MKETKQKDIANLTQAFENAPGKIVFLKDILSDEDWWESKAHGKISVILTHRAVEKIAGLAGFEVLDYVVKTQPDCYNNYQYTVQATIKDKNGVLLNPEWGEANRSNLGSRGRNNPANMAQKRAFDRTVLKALGLTGLLSEEELSDEKNNEQMNTLKPEDAKIIAPVINNILAIKTKGQLSTFNTYMAKEKIKYNKDMLDAIRKTYKAKVAEINTSNTKF
jgi:hypothetical protein